MTVNYVLSTDFKYLLVIFEATSGYLHESFCDVENSVIHRFCHKLVIPLKSHHQLTTKHTNILKVKH